MIGCRGCGGTIPPTRRSNARYCNILCRRKAFRLRYPDKCREWVRSANKRRYYSDPEFRRVAVERTRKSRHLIMYGEYLGDNPLANVRDRYRFARAKGYRSGLEVEIAERLKSLGVAFKYEPFSIPYTPLKLRKKYLPDAILPNGIVLEVKGRFVTADRQKHKAVKAEYPELDLRFVFSNSRSRISKTSKTTYATWCEANGFLYADKHIPLEWIKEPTNVASMTLIQRFLKGDIK